MGRNEFVKQKEEGIAFQLKRINNKWRNKEFAPEMPRGKVAQAYRGCVLLQTAEVRLDWHFIKITVVSFLEDGFVRWRLWEVYQ